MMVFVMIIYIFLFDLKSLAIYHNAYLYMMCNSISVLISQSTHNKPSLHAAQIELDEAEVYLGMENSLLFIYFLEFEQGSYIQ